MSMNNRYQVRCVSFPTRSHPSTLSIEEELNKLKTWEATFAATSGSICKGLSGLEDLYICMSDLLNLSSTQQILSRHGNEFFKEKFLDGSVKILDICGITRDMMLQMRDSVQALQSMFRRRKSDVSIENGIAGYLSLRKKVKKDSKKMITELKQMDNVFELLPLIDDQDHHLSAVLRVLREVTAMNMFIFQALLSFLAVPFSTPKSSRWSLVAKLMHKGVIACAEDAEKMNELYRVDSALCSLSKSSAGSSDSEKIQAAQEKLEVLDNVISDFENSLESLFRRIIKSRSSMLNIISQ